MPDAPDFLRRFTEALSSTDFSFDLGRKALLDRLASSGIVPSREEASLLFEKAEVELSAIVYSERWAIQYNVYTDRVYFDRLAPVEYLGRVAEHHNLSLALRLTEHLRRLTPRQYELLIRSFVERLPDYREVRVSAPGPDGGVDFTAKRQTVEMAVPALVVGQAKHWKTRVSAPEVQKLMGVMLQHSRNGPVEGMFIALNGFTPPALRLPERCPLPLELISTPRLVELMSKHSVGTKAATLTCVTPDPTFWGELNAL